MKSTWYLAYFVFLHIFCTHAHATPNFDEDQYPSTMLVTPKVRVIGVTEEEDGPTLECQFHSQTDSALFWSKIQNQLKDDPIFFMGMQDLAIPPLGFETKKQQAASLNELAQQAGHDETRLQKQLTQSRKYEEKEEIAELHQLVIDTKSQFKKNSEISKNNANTQEKAWKGQISSFYKNAIELRNSENRRKWRKFFQKFRNLREANPKSFSPFIPLLTILIDQFDQKLLEIIIKEAIEHDRYQTYAVTVNYLLFGLTSKFNEKEIFFQKAEIWPVVKILRTFYKKDAFLAAIASVCSTLEISAQCPKTLELKNWKQFQVGITQFDTGLTQSVQQLLSGNFPPAINTLTSIKPNLVGFSPIHHTLALSWALQGGTNKALEIAIRTAKLPEFNTDSMSLYGLNLLQTVFRPEQDQDKTRVSEFLKKNNLISKLITMIRKAPDLNFTSQIDFVKAATTCLEQGWRRAPEDLPVIYLGTQWIASHPIPSHQTFNQLGPHLEKFVSMAAALCYALGDVDPWIAEHIKMNQLSDTEINFTISNPGILYGRLNDSPLPEVQFKTLRLTRSSARSFATALTKKIVSLLETSMLDESDQKNILNEIDKIEDALPHDESVFYKLLAFGLSTTTQSEGSAQDYSNSVRLLETYLSKKKPPYKMDPKFLDWAKFSVNSHRPDQLIPKSILESASASSLPKEWLKNVKFNKTLNLPTQHSLDRATYAFSRIAERTSLIHEELMAGDEDSIYSMFLSSQIFSGWMQGESFDDWGARVKKLLQHPFFNASTFSQLAPMPFGDGPSEKENVFHFPVNSKTSRHFIKQILLFWSEFYKITKEKNEFILNDGNEEERETLSQFSFRNLDLSNLKTLVEMNKPDQYPNFKQLSKEDQAKIRETIASKHKHHEEVNELKSYWEAARRQFKNDSDLVIFMAATLITNAEFKREDTYQSVVVESPTMAQDIYRLLLEDSLDQLFRKIIIERGPAHWTFKEDDFLEISIALSKLIGQFHGPETHRDGTAPLDPHYNPKIWTKNQSFTNTHLYFLE